MALPTCQNGRTHHRDKTRHGRLSGCGISQRDAQALFSRSVADPTRTLALPLAPGGWLKSKLVVFCSSATGSKKNNFLVWCRDATCCVLRLGHPGRSVLRPYEISFGLLLLYEPLPPLLPSYLSFYPSPFCG